MPDQKLTAPNVTVLRDGLEPLEDIQTDNRDLLAWETVRLRHKWPDAQTSPTKWLTFLAWSAARRQGLIGTEVTHGDWEATVVEVRPREDEEDDEDETGAPFPEGDTSPPVGGAGDSDTDPAVRLAG